MQAATLAAVAAPARPFLAATEAWVLRGDRLVLASADHRALGDPAGFAAASALESFGPGEGLPGRAWAEGRPVVMRPLAGPAFARAEAAERAGLTAGVAVPVFAGRRLTGVLVALLAPGEGRAGGVEVWEEEGGRLRLAAGDWGEATAFEAVTRATTFAPGQGLPGGVWAARAPIVLRDLSRGGFVRAEAARAAGLATGLGLPVPAPEGPGTVLTLLSAPGTPIAHRFEIWAVQGREAVLVDGLCAVEGPLWSQQNPDPRPRRARPGEGLVGAALATGAPGVQAGGALPAGHASGVALPIHRDGAPAHVVAWYL